MKLLHLSHHEGCLADIERVGLELGVDVESARFDDGYNISKERADRAWHRWRGRMEACDVVMVSDTAPLSRIVLQHLDEFPGHLVIWICNRFDYADAATNDCEFPDPAYYELFKEATGHPRVHLIAYTAFEHVWARMHGIDTGDRVIRPLGLRGPAPSAGIIRSSFDKGRSFFVPPYHNDTVFMDLPTRCRQLGITTYSGRYGGPEDLRGFRGVIHIPYAWSNFALFEHLQGRLPILIPAPKFLLSLSRQGGFWWPQLHLLKEYIGISEWYSSDHEFIVTFRSWRDLRRSVRRLDVDAVLSRMEERAAVHQREVLEGWREVFSLTPGRGSE